MTLDLIASRKESELGGSSGILSPGEWAVYSEPERIEELLSWLRTKGHRELHLKSQLLKFRYYLENGMKKRNADLTAHLRENFDAVRRSSRASKTDSNGAGGQQGRLGYMSWKTPWTRASRNVTAQMSLNLDVKSKRVITVFSVTEPCVRDFPCVSALVAMLEPCISLSSS